MACDGTLPPATAEDFAAKFAPFRDWLDDLPASGSLHAPDALVEKTFDERVDAFIRTFVGDPEPSLARRQVPKGTDATRSPWAAGRDSSTWSSPPAGRGRAVAASGAGAGAGGGSRAPTTPTRGPGKRARASPLLGSSSRYRASPTPPKPRFQLRVPPAVGAPSGLGGGGSGAAATPTSFAALKQRLDQQLPGAIEKVPKAKEFKAALASSFACGRLELTRTLKRANQLPNPVENSAARNQDRTVDPTDVLYTVLVYDKRRRRGGHAQEFVILGSQKLTQLRDKIYSEDRVANFMLIGDTCYDDTRKSSVRYSEPVVKWAAANAKLGFPRGEDWGLLKAGTMDDVTIGELPIELGRHYLYAHQGNCEHILIFSDMTHPHAAAPTNWHAYPLHTYQALIKHRNCSVCKVSLASYICYGDRHADTNPCVFCTSCYHALHYSADGQLQYSDYEVYPYYHEYA